MSVWEKPLSLAKCERCSAVVFAGWIAGAVVADPATLGPEGYRRALIAGRRTFRLLRTSKGAPHMLADDAAAWASELDRVAAHGCGVGTKPMDEVVQGPCRAPAKHGSGPDGSLRPAVLAGVTAESSAATIATNPLSDRRRTYEYLARRCCYCDRIIGTGARFGMQQGQNWIWVGCAQCMG